LSRARRGTEAYGFAPWVEGCAGVPGGYQGRKYRNNLQRLDAHGKQDAVHEVRDKRSERRKRHDKPLLLAGKNADKERDYREGKRKDRAKVKNEAAVFSKHAKKVHDLNS
jgi:hypothetical protein